MAIFSNLWAVKLLGKIGLFFIRWIRKSWANRQVILFLFFATFARGGGKAKPLYSNLALYQRLDTHCNSSKFIAMDQVTSVSFHLLFSFKVVSYPGNRGTTVGCSLPLVGLQRAPELGYLETWTVLTETRPLEERRIYFTFCLVGERNRTGKGSKHCTEV